MATSSLRPLARMAVEKSCSRFSPGPLFTEFHSLTWLSHIEKPSWCSATGPANLAPASTNSCAHSFGSKAPPADLSFGANWTQFPARSAAPLMKLWYGHTDGSPNTLLWWLFSTEPLLYMFRGYHSLLKAGTLKAPQW